MPSNCKKYKRRPSADTLFAFALFAILIGPIGAETNQQCNERTIILPRAGETPTSAVIQAALDHLNICNGGKLELLPGKYPVDTPIKLRDKVSIYGTPNQTELVVQSSIVLTQDSNELLDGIVISGLKLTKDKSNRSPTTAIVLHGHQNTTFENLSFHGFKDDSIITISPQVKRVPAMNAVFNTYRKWYADACRECIQYKGNEGSVISNNVWYDITLRRVYGRGISAIRWADSERWYNLYAQAWDPNSILIDLNVSDKNWEQIDRFHFYSPVLVYAPRLQGDDKRGTPVAIRFGKGTLKHFFFGVISDKLWKDFIKDDGAVSYYVLKGTAGEGFKEPMGVIAKGFRD